MTSLGAHETEEDTLPDQFQTPQAGEQAAEWQIMQIKESSADR